jgi:hypothetical protein
MPQLRALTVGDNPAGWQQAGFSVVDDSTTIGSVTITFDERRGPGIASWTLSGLPEDGADTLHHLGLPTHSAIHPESVTGLTSDDSIADPPAVAHANAVDRIDHLVIQAADMAAATSGLAGVGFDARHHRPIPHSEEPAQQVFYWAGDVIVELVGPMPVTWDQRVGASTEADPSTNVDPSTEAGAGRVTYDAWFWGLALASSDLDHTVATLGSKTSDPRPAVQPGRHITTIDHKSFGISVPLAVLSPHPSDTADA